MKTILRSVIFALTMNYSFALTIDYSGDTPPELRFKVLTQPSRNSIHQQVFFSNTKLLSLVKAGDKSVLEFYEKNNYSFSITTYEVATPSFIRIQINTGKNKTRIMFICLKGGLLHKIPYADSKKLTELAKNEKEISDALTKSMSKGNAKKINALGMKMSEIKTKINLLQQKIIANTKNEVPRD